MEELIDKLLERRAKKQAKMARLLETPTQESRDLNADEDKEFRELEGDIKAIDERVAELRNLIKRDQEAAAAAKQVLSTPRAHVSDPPVYRKGGQTSFFRDLYRANAKGDRDAYERLDRNNKMVADAKAKATGEQRAISTGSGAGGEFVPPLWSTGLAAA